MKENKLEHSWMEKYAPPGVNLAQEVLYWVMTMTISTLWSMNFLLRYFQYRSNLYETRAGKTVLIEGAMMPTFEFLIEDLFEIFVLVFVFCVIVAVYHYFYHYQGSKMMYLMKRLPDKWELHRRCLTLPIAAFIITIFYVLVLRALYYAIYLIFTPQQYLLLR